MRLKRLLTVGGSVLMLLQALAVASAQTATPTSTPTATATATPTTAASLPEAGVGYPTYFILFAGVSLVIFAGMYLARERDI